jgi:hypothetical protein
MRGGFRVERFILKGKQHAGQFRLLPDGAV